MIALGEKIKFKDNQGHDLVGTVTGKKQGGMLFNRKTGEINKNTIKLRIKPDNGARAFWTLSMTECE